jgi:hypothetical protein
MATQAWEHTFVTAQPHAHVRFRRAIERRALWLAEDAARELPNLPLEDALQLVHLYAERGSPRYEKAAMRWLERYLAEGSPRLQHLAEITTRKLASRTSGPRARDAPPRSPCSPQSVPRSMYRDRLESSVANP